MKGGDGKWAVNPEASLNKQGAAITPGDRVYALSRRFKTKVETTLEEVRDASLKGKMGVSLSGGKDSVVALDLVRRIVPNAPAGFFDSGCEFNQTYDVIDHYGAEYIQMEIPLVNLLKAGAYWGYDGPDVVDKDLVIDFYHHQVAHPSHIWVTRNNIDIIVMGLRGQENPGRMANYRRRGKLYLTHTWLGVPVRHFNPLSNWTDADVWAYIASRELFYNAIYDKFAEAGAPREEWRVSALMGLCGASHGGRFVRIKQCAPEVFGPLTRYFPRMLEYI